MIQIPTTCNLHANNFDKAFPQAPSRCLPSSRPVKTAILCVSSPVGYSGLEEEPSESSERRLISALKGDNNLILKIKCNIDFVEIEKSFNAPLTVRLFIMSS